MLIKIFKIFKIFISKLWNYIYIIKYSVKILLILFILFPLSLYPEESKQQPSKSYPPHSIGISFRFGGGNVLNIADHYYTPLQTTLINFYLGKRYGKTQYIPFLLSIRLSAPMSTKDYRATLPVMTGSFPQSSFINEFRWGFLFGASQYLFDKRDKDSGLGWSMMLDGGMSFDLPKSSRLNTSETNLLNSYVNLGVELDFRAQYNFYKYSAITFGFNIGYMMGYLMPSPGIDPEGFPSLVPEGLILNHAFIFGFSVGVIF